MSEIKIVNVSDDKKDILWNYLQKYLYEMSAYYSEPMSPDGSYPYWYFDAYFENTPGREAFFFMKDREVIGFAMINTHSFDEGAVDHCLAEFTIFPIYRGNGSAESALRLLLRTRPGHWQLKYAIKNDRGMRFWKKALEPYRPLETSFGESERLVNFYS